MRGIAQIVFGAAEEQRIARRPNQSEQPVDDRLNHWSVPFLEIGVSSGCAEPPKTGRVARLSA